MSYTEHTIVTTHRQFKVSTNGPWGAAYDRSARP